MPRVHFVKKARKDVQGSDIKKGESYYYWEFRYGGKHVSRTPPKPSQLTQSEFLGTVYSLQERINEFSCDTPEEFEDFKQEIVSELEELRDNTQEKLDNMPEQLQSASTGELLQERIDGVDSWISEVEGIDCDVDEDGIRQEIQDEHEDDEEYEDADLESDLTEGIREKVMESVEELQNIDAGL